MPPSITTRSYDLARTGAIDNETALTASAIRTRGIVKLFSMAIPDDPRLEAQPLAVGGLCMKDGKTHDVIFQASMGNTVYAFDAQTGGQLWKTNLGRPIASTKPIDAWLVNVSWGILSTPVIDEAAGILYACAWISADGSAAKGQHFLAALRPVRPSETRARRRRIPRRSRRRRGGEQAGRGRGVSPRVHVKRCARWRLILGTGIGSSCVRVEHSGQHPMPCISSTCSGSTETRSESSA